MIADLKPYPAYKDSGLAWVGNVPNHWPVVPNRGIFKLRKVLVGDRHKDFKLLSLTKLGVIVRDISTGKGKFSADMGTSQEVRPGDLVFCLFDVPETPRTVGLSRHRGMITGAYTVFTCPNPDLVEYIEFFYRAMDDRKLLSPLYSGLRNTIQKERFLGTKTPQPPPDEQAAIVKFLDWANARLERTICAKRRVIALLTEQKQAIIHRAVTRGLDPTVRLKPSGIAWLGDIPAHWEVRRFKFLARINSGQVDPRLPSYWKMVLIAPNHIERGNGRLLREETADEQGADSGKYFVRKGQVIYSKIRPNLRKATIALRDCLCSADMYPISPMRGIMSGEYFLQLLLSEPFTKFAVDTSMRVAMPKVNREALADCPMWFPNGEEQDRIIAFIAAESRPIDTAISRVEREIDLLREYRTRLVADVVTGKLDVREAAARLPQEEVATALEPEALDPMDASDAEAELEE